ATGVEDAMLEPGLDNTTANLLIRADFSSAFKPFAEASYSHINALQQSTQPTFISSTLNPIFSINNPFLSPQARALLVSELNPGATTFQIQRFNNDIGTRAENHSRDTYRAVLGVEGDISHVGSLHYEIAGNYGRTENFYATGGNVLTANYNRATAAVLAPAAYAGTNFVLNSAGQKVVCAVNADASTTNDDANCYPLNVFGYGAGDPRALNYAIYRSTRHQWAQEIDATAYISGDSTGLFSLPGGPVGFALGGEYRQEKAYSAYDATTAAGLTFLNGSAPFAPPAVNIKEGYGELKVPLLANFPLIHELTFEGAGRVSDYGGSTGAVAAWDAGVIYAPIHDLRLRATYARSVRAPNLSNLYATPAVTFANGLTDPCDQPGGTNASDNINSGPNRAKNCAAAGVPTTVTYAVDAAGTLATVPFTNVAASGIAGSNQGNPGLTPEIGYDFTASATFDPHWIPGLSLQVTYYNIRIKNVISGLTGQQIIDRCYDDPGGVSNPFCAVVFRRSGTGSSIQDYTFNGQTSRVLNNIPTATFPLVGNGLGFINQPFNFAKLTTRGLDFEGTYSHVFDNGFSINYHLTVSYVMDRLSYSYISDPSRFDRIDSTLGDPKWQGAFNVQMKYHQFDLSYNERYVGKQIVSGLSYETFFASQGRPALNPEARPFVYYNPIVYHNLRVGVDVNDKFRFYGGVDNLTNELPPYDLTGTGSDAIYPNTGRFVYAGIEAKF
ncbi:MAG: TonB-dependent receptor, partial [Candidatus Eremiobacteraeota bacterium]|nr:TonB-dependent receptor [Candidatus Eremiobacteraeota bacterium]